MHKIDTMTQFTRSAICDSVFRVLANFAASDKHGPIPVRKLFAMTADHLVASDTINKPKFLGGKNFDQYLEIEEDAKFPNYEVSENIVLLIRQRIWELYLQGILTPATKVRDVPERGDRQIWLFFDAFMLTPYGVQILTDKSGRIIVHDPDGYLAIFKNSNKPQDTEMMRYLDECASVFRSGHLLASVILLAIASERLIEVLAESLRDALGKPEGTDWFDKNYAKQRIISERFKVVSMKIMGVYGDKLNDEKLKEPFQNVVKLTFDTIRLARNDIAHHAGREFTWNEVSGFLHNFVQYYRYVNQIIKFLSNNQKERAV
jgi:hypothetical protein